MEALLQESLWRTPLGVPHRHSCRCRASVFITGDRHRDESRRGTHECVRHIAGGPNHSVSGARISKSRTDVTGL
jgi:hypothetical protein